MIGGFDPAHPDMVQRSSPEQVFRVQYDTNLGVMTTLDSYIREVVEVRKNLQDKVLRQAVIYELEKLGYTIVSPEEGEQ